MSELLGYGENVLRKINNGWYILLPALKEERTYWKLVCKTDDPLWAPKCIEELEKHYPEKK